MADGAKDGQPNHPARVVVHGLTGPAGAELAAKHSGAIRQFHRAQQQNFELSADGVQVQKNSRRLADGTTLAYSNVFGQERIDVTVRPVEGGKEGPPAQEGYWDFVLFEMVFGAASFFHIRAEVVGREDQEWTDSYGEGIGMVLRSADMEPGSSIGIRSDENCRFSVRVDLRRFHPGGVKIRLLGRVGAQTVLGLPGLYPNQEMDPETPYEIVGLGKQFVIYRMSHMDAGATWGYAASGNAGGLDDLQMMQAHHPQDPQLAKVQFVNTDTTNWGNGTIQTGPYWNKTDPPWPGQNYPNRWSWFRHELPDYNPAEDDGKQIPGPDVEDIVATYGDFTIDVKWPGTQFRKSNHYEGWSIDGVNAAPVVRKTGQIFLTVIAYKFLTIPMVKVGGGGKATLKSIFFDGANPLNATTRWNVIENDELIASSYQWERAGRPERWPLKEIGKASIPAGDEDELIGIITIEPHFQRGSVTFTPA